MTVSGWADLQHAETFNFDSVHARRIKRNGSGERSSEYDCATGQCFARACQVSGKVHERAGG